MRSECDGVIHEPEKPARSRLEQNPGADGRRRGGASGRHDDPAGYAARHRRQLGDVVGACRPHGRIRLSPHRRARQDQSRRRLGHDPRRARLHAANLLVPRPVCRAESRRRQPRVRPLDAGQRLPDRDGVTAASAVSGPVGREAFVDPRPEAADHGSGRADADQAAGADRRQRPNHARLLSCVSAGPKRRRRAVVAKRSVPTISPKSLASMVGTLRFAHPTNRESTNPGPCAPSQTRCETSPASAPAYWCCSASSDSCRRA